MNSYSAKKQNNNNKICYAFRDHTHTESSSSHRMYQRVASRILNVYLTRIIAMKTCQCVRVRFRMLLFFGNDFVYINCMTKNFNNCGTSRQNDEKQVTESLLIIVCVDHRLTMSLLVSLICGHNV